MPRGGDRNARAQTGRGSWVTRWLIPGLLLAAFFIPGIVWNPLGPHARAPAARTRALIRSIDVGLQAFRQDFGHLPTDALEGGSETNDPRWIRLWLLGIDDHGEPSEAVRSNPDWAGPYVDVEFGRHLDADNAYVFIDAWGNPMRFEMVAPVFNPARYDIWSLGKDGAGTKSMADLPGATAGERQQAYRDLRVRGKLVNADNLGNW
jgi:hypothetical protein